MWFLILQYHLFFTIQKPKNIKKRSVFNVSIKSDLNTSGPLVLSIPIQGKSHQGWTIFFSPCKNILTVIHWRLRSSPRGKRKSGLTHQPAVACGPQEPAVIKKCNNWFSLHGCSNIYYINDNLDKRTWTYIFGACCATTVFVPSFRNYRIWSFLGLIMTTYTAWYMTIASLTHGQVGQIDCLIGNMRELIFTSYTHFLWYVTAQSYAFIFIWEKERVWVKGKWV